jgi:hypothetical protein
VEKLLELQKLDLKIESCRAREQEIPRQKSKFDVQRQRLDAELEEVRKMVQELELEQRACESEIAEKQAQIDKYNSQLLQVKENAQYTALLHEIDFLKKQISQREERIITIMLELDEARARLKADEKRIEEELRRIDSECAAIDKELEEAVAAREKLEQQRKPLAEAADQDLLRQYVRIRKSKKKGAAAVPLRGEVCGGCQMHVPPQVQNETMAGKVHSCKHCGRLLYNPEALGQENASV